ncbi:MAG: DUF2236 domain-containing protein [Acidobacteria bacterium]|nr:DUF2236 domain-containing protein [Acidobacteriota bacterium]
MKGSPELSTSKVLSLYLLIPAGANVVMQLALAPVARAVLESPVREGSLRERPWKRSRTTLTYAGLAAFGTEEERRALRRAVARQHQRVRSDGATPYDASDPDLQLWVAACMYVGLRDGYRLFYGAPPEDALYELASRFATTLNVPPHRWPPTRAEFERYWHSQRDRAEVDGETREFFDDLLHLRWWSRVLSRGLGNYHARMSMGFVDPVIRERVGWEWSNEHQARWERSLRPWVRAARWTPASFASLPLRVLMAHGRWRMRRQRAFTD